MQLERLVIEAGSRTLTADLHPKLTVIPGLSDGAREALAGELIDSLAGARPGVHLEVSIGAEHLTVFRPTVGRHRVIDTGSIADVTSRHLGHDGEIDLLAGYAVSRAEARRALRFTRDDLVLHRQADAWVARLAATEQRPLWNAARDVRATEEVLAQASDDVGTSPDDAALVTRIEDRHARLVEATETYDRIRQIALTHATVGALGIMGAMWTDARLPLGPFVALTTLALVLTLYYRVRVNRAAKQERLVVSEAGANDYSTFHVQRVSALLDSDRERRRFMLAVSDHARANATWEAMVGDVPVDFALENESRVRAAATLHDSFGGLPGDGDGSTAGDHAELAQAVFARLEAVRALGAGTPARGAGPLPLVLDDPFDGLDPALRPLLLELLSAHAGNPQFVLLTSDPDVVSWAQVEQLTGDLAVAEPVIGSTGDGSLPARRHATVDAGS